MTARTTLEATDLNADLDLNARRAVAEGNGFLGLYRHSGGRRERRATAFFDEYLAQDSSGVVDLTRQPEPALPAAVDVAA